MHAAVNPVHAAVNPVHTAVKPVHAAVNPVHTAVNPVHTAVNPVHAAVTARQASISLVMIQGGKRLFPGFTSLTMTLACTAACAVDLTLEASAISLQCSMKHRACPCAVMYCISMPVVTYMLQQFTWNKNAWLQKLLVVSKRLCEVLCMLKGWQ